MKLLRVAMLSFFVVLFSAAAYAGSIPIDPVIKIGGPKAAPPPPDPSITSTTFSILSPTGTSGPFTNDNCELVGTSETGCTFDNQIIGPDETGQTIYSLAFEFKYHVDPNDPSTNLTCGSLTTDGSIPIFANCTVSSPGDDTWVVKFIGGSIPYGNTFYFDVTGFGPNTDFGGTASTVTPEPGTITLFLGGLGVFLAQRKLRSRQTAK